MNVIGQSLQSGLSSRTENHAGSTYLVQGASVDYQYVSPWTLTIAVADDICNASVDTLQRVETLRVLRRLDLFHDSLFK